MKWFCSFFVDTDDLLWWQSSQVLATICCVICCVGSTYRCVCV